jgi:hypothetical protein
LDKDYAGATVKVNSQQDDYMPGKVLSSGTYVFNADGINAETAQGNWKRGSERLSGNSGELTDQTTFVTLNHSTVTQLNETFKYLMLIPQTTDAAGDLTVKLTYTIKTAESIEGTVAYPVIYKLPAATYDLGKQYTYNFIFTLNPVEFDVNLDIQTWGNETTTDLGV